MCGKNTKIPIITDEELVKLTELLNRKLEKEIEKEKLPKKRNDHEEKFTKNKEMEINEQNRK